MNTPIRFKLHDAVLRCDEAEVEKLIRSGIALDELDERGMAPIHWAVYGGYTEIVAMLIEAGADVNIKTGDGTTAFWHAEDDFGLTDIADLLRAAGAIKCGGHSLPAKPDSKLLRFFRVFAPRRFTN